MKKQEKIDIIQSGIEHPAICRCYFTYDPNYFYYYPNAVNDKFILGQEEKDFMLDGYSIRKLSHLKKVEIKNDKCNEINQMLGITDQIIHPNIDIQSWHSIFKFLSQLDTYVQLEDAFDDQFVIGTIEKITRDRLYLKSFDADDLWSDEPLEIRYSDITSVQWNTRYANSWKYYFEHRQKTSPCYSMERS